MRKLIVSIMLIFSFFIFNLDKTYALTVNEINEKSLINFSAYKNKKSTSLKNYVFILDRDESTDEWLDDYNQEQDCDPDNSLLGNPNDPDSVAWLLQQLLNYIRVIGPILVVILSSVEFAKVIIQSDDEAMGKAQKKLINRLILVVVLFFIPTLVSALLSIFGITTDPTCGLQ